jgi:hypothetical protein
LGVWIDTRIKWRGHVGQVGTKVQQLLGVLGRIRADMDEHCLLSLYNSMVLPHLQYCLIVWEDFEAGRNGAFGRPEAYILGQSPNGNLHRSCRKERQKVSMVYKGGKTLRPKPACKQTIISL